jgi:hypothetical protein
MQVGCNVTFLEAWSENRREWVETMYSSTGYFGESADMNMNENHKYNK